jgi:CAP12/Pycsar effector protein, TIR domain
MSVIRRVLVSLPADQWLAPQQNDLKWGIVDEISRLGYLPEIFTNPKGMPGLAAGKAWSATELDSVARRCVGAAILGFSRWGFLTSRGQIRLATEFNHYEGAVGFTLGLPLLVLVQEDVERRVVFDSSYGGYVGVFASSADRTWLTTDSFLVPFNYWKDRLARRRDVFLGYCGSSEGTAQNLKRFLQSSEIDATVLDWRDFTPGRSILQQIEEAAERCSAGIFLFTKDDKLPTAADPNQAAPRDNVVFEAGYFINSKGKDHVLIIREDGAKMPADLGGDIYGPLADKSNIGPIEDAVRKFVTAL